MFYWKIKLNKTETFYGVCGNRKLMSKVFRKAVDLRIDTEVKKQNKVSVVYDLWGQFFWWTNLGWGRLFGGLNPSLAEKEFYRVIHNNNSAIFMSLPSTIKLPLETAKLRSSIYGVYGIQKDSMFILGHSKKLETNRTNITGFIDIYGLGSKVKSYSHRKYRGSKLAIGKLKLKSLKIENIPLAILALTQEYAEGTDKADANIKKYLATQDLSQLKPCEWV